ncbi:hypothetical protein AB0F91_01145 [Amycolatopsis sp. NPDC023774]|uniref:hypothetical protein n=1 Tax=Amycolatopsis sp. NPDC023774 TaxID=3155015 RepID=UPI0033DA6A61
MLKPFTELWTPPLIGLLAEHGTPDTACLAYFGPATRGFEDHGNVRVQIGRLGDAATLYEDPETGYSPPNLRADDRSWCRCTDYDL